MSLLQEALKRKEEEKSQLKPAGENKENISSALPEDGARLSLVEQKAAEITNAESAPDIPRQSMPVAGRPENIAGQGLQRKMSLLWLIVAVTAVFVCLAVTAGGIFAFNRFSKTVQVKTVPPAGPVHAAIVSAGETNVSAGQPVSAPGPETALKATAQTQQAAPSPAAVTQNMQTNSLQQPSAVPVASNPAPARPFFTRQKAPPSVSQPMWPALKLMGILRGTGKADSTAFINGKMISAGQSISDVTIVKIQADGVIMKYGGEEKFVRVGATSY